MHTHAQLIQTDKQAMNGQDRVNYVMYFFSIAFSCCYYCRFYFFLKHTRGGFNERQPHATHSSENIKKKTKTKTKYTTQKRKEEKKKSYCRN